MLGRRDTAALMLSRALMCNLVTPKLMSLVQELLDHKARSKPLLF